MGEPELIARLISNLHPSSYVFVASCSDLVKCTGSWVALLPMQHCHYLRESLVCSMSHARSFLQAMLCAWHAKSR